MAKAPPVDGAPHVPSDLPASVVKVARRHLRDAFARQAELEGTVEGLAQSVLFLAPPHDDMGVVPFLIFGQTAESAGGVFLFTLKLPTTYPHAPPDFFPITENGLYATGRGTPCVSVGRYHSQNYAATMKFTGFANSVAGVFFDPKSLGLGMNVCYRSAGKGKRSSVSIAAQKSVAFNEDPTNRAAHQLWRGFRAHYDDLPLRIEVAAALAAGAKLTELADRIPALAGMPVTRDGGAAVAGQRAMEDAARADRVAAAGAAAGGAAAASIDLADTDALEAAFGGLDL
jgi:hypothetical protein